MRICVINIYVYIYLCIYIAPTEYDILYEKFDIDGNSQVKDTYEYALYIYVYLYIYAYIYIYLCILKFDIDGNSQVRYI
jgi:hypothetical protein